MNHSVNAWDPPQDVVVGWGDATGHRESTIAPKQRKRPTSAPPRRDRLVCMLIMIIIIIIILIIIIIILIMLESAVWNLYC